MRLVQLIVFASHIILNLAQVTQDDANACMNKDYIPDESKPIAKKFAYEYNIMTDTPRRWFCNAGRDASQEEQANMRQLCACVIYKIMQKDYPDEKLEVDHFKKIYKNLEVETMNIRFPIGYFLFFWRHKFSSIYCKFDDGECIVAKGPRNQSETEKQEYNLYIGAYTKDNNFLFRGFIEKVDVEMPVYGNAAIQLETEDETPSEVK